MRRSAQRIFDMRVSLWTIALALVSKVSDAALQNGTCASSNYAYLTSKECSEEAARAQKDFTELASSTFPPGCVRTGTGPEFVYNLNISSDVECSSEVICDCGNLIPPSPPVYSNPPWNEMTIGITGDCDTEDPVMVTLNEEECLAIYTEQQARTSDVKYTSLDSVDFPVGCSAVLYALHFYFNKATGGKKVF
ncbi:hypothetical protein CYMTET_23211 [Cymbomonas tetramitiformis]|uniref:Uncharacterized protein n=1 Tax=Cymbomonas tetramitiformis TaxID=36881 RepID=A0AAE0FZ42_9CHLO|nr:hypothetical protein CYMTET_23211 [Cymbomonas tetramitiformis]